MNESQDNLTSRRDFLKNTGRFAAASALAGVALPHVHAAEENTIRVALIGCGGRGGGAAANAMSVKSCPTQLTAMADHRLKSSYDTLKRQYDKQVDVPGDRKFIGFDAYQRAMDTLRPGDIVILTTPLAFRWVHFTYAIQKGLNVFMEKPLTADGPTSRRMLKLAEEATAKNLKVGVGLMSRHSRALQELHQRIQDGEIGDLILLRGYRMHGPVGSAFSEKWPGKPSELLWQIQHFHSFLWASGGCFSDFYIHHTVTFTLIRISIPTRWNTRSRTVPSLSWTGAATWVACRCTSAMRKGARAWRLFRTMAIVGSLPALTRARTRIGPTCSGHPRSTRTNRIPI